jgi:DNA recombination protein RmuC
MEIIFLIIGLLIGGVSAWLIFKFKFESVKGIPPGEVEDLKKQISFLSIEHAKAEENVKRLEENLKQSNADLNLEREKSGNLKSELASLTSDYKNLQQRLDEQKEEVEKLQEKFAVEFKNIANEILEDKSKKFTDQNKTNIESILNPLNEKIKDFEKRVNEIYNSDTKERAGLAEQIKALTLLNTQMGKEATNLTNALKGQSKTQGNWGELILETILEKSGLEKGREYQIQQSLTTEQGKRYQPDVVIYLPDNKCLVIDSKVSLVAYEKYCSSEEETERMLSLRDHIGSIRKHIKDLSAKNYQNLYQINTLDFVLLFMPIEPAFGLAVQNDINIFNEAFEKNIVIVSPSTLLATLRTIASIWRQEHQNKNAIEIARQSGALYDKFEGFVKDLTDLGNKINASQSSYQDAMKKLYSGSGNLISRVEKIKKLGAKATKSLPQSLLDRVDDGDIEEDENEKLLSK